VAVTLFSCYNQPIPVRLDALSAMHII